MSGGLLWAFNGTSQAKSRVYPGNCGFKTALKLGERLYIGVKLLNFGMMGACRRQD